MALFPQTHEARQGKPSPTTDHVSPGLGIFLDRENSNELNLIAADKIKTDFNNNFYQLDSGEHFSGAGLAAHIPHPTPK